MVKEFKIILNQLVTHTAFYTGSEVSGEVYIMNDEPKNYNGVQVSLIGEADCRWSETYTTGSGQNQTTHTRYYHSHEDYINEVCVLWRPDQAPDRLFPPGSYSYPFRFVLNGNLPPSFQGSYGYIRYIIEARISTGALKFDKRAVAEIPVSHVLNINTPNLLTALEFENQKTVCCLCCASAPIVLTVQMPRTGYCIGESITFTANLQNGSGRRVRIRALLSQTVLFTAQGSHRTSSTTVSNIAFSDFIEGGRTQQWSPEQIQIPVGTQTSITTCRIITISHSLSVSVIIPWSINLSVNVPLVIGNVPLQSTQAQQAFTAASDAFGFQAQPEYPPPPPYPI